MTGAFQPDTVERTVDAFHRGHFHVVQPAKGGHRAGVDAMIVAAAVPSSFGGIVSDFGAGSGAAGLAVVSRCPQAQAMLVEREPLMCRMARETLALAANAHIAGRASVVEADVSLRGNARRLAGLADAAADAVIMNPPFNLQVDRRTDQPLRRAAHVMSEELPEEWVRTAAAVLRPGGWLAMIARPQSLNDLLAACQGRFGAVELMPVAPRPGAAAIRVVLRARKGSRKPLALLPALLLHNDTGNAFSPRTDAILNGQTSLFGD